MLSREDVGYVAIRNALAEELGVKPSDLEAEAQARRDSVTNLIVNSEGAYTILGIDRFDNEHWVHEKYRGSDAKNKALFEARKLTKEGMRNATDASVATVYYAYDPQGNYLGGDTYNKE